MKTRKTRNLLFMARTFNLISSSPNIATEEGGDGSEASPFRDCVILASAVRIHSYVYIRMCVYDQR